MLRPGDFHPQDWLLIIQALTEYSHLVEVDEPWRADRADQLVEAIAAEHELHPERCVEQIDFSWGRTESRAWD